MQPAIPAPGYIWTPGYWAWVARGLLLGAGNLGTAAHGGPAVDPGYWGLVDGAYLWHGGYWGPHVGFYGGINYGCGYSGVGYQGGYWHGHEFCYNRAVQQRAQYQRHERLQPHGREQRAPVTRVSFNGGAGGIAARPSRTELAAVHERHVGVHERPAAPGEHGAR